MIDTGKILRLMAKRQVDDNHRNEGNDQWNPPIWRKKEAHQDSWNE